MASQTTQVIYGNETWVTSVIGSTRAYFQVRNWQLESGRLFTDGELRGRKGVCIIGTTLRKELFGDQKPLGNTIRLEKLSCQVIGIRLAIGAWSKMC